MPHATENVDAILLDLHSRATAIALLAPVQLMIDLLDVDGHARGQTFDYRDERATM